MDVNFSTDLFLFSYHLIYLPSWSEVAIKGEDPELCM